MILIQDVWLSILFSTFLSFFLYFIFNKKNFLLDQTNTSKHKQLTLKNSSNKVILCGGIIVFINSLFFFDNQLYIIKIFSFFILIKYSWLSKKNKELMKTIMPPHNITLFEESFDVSCLCLDELIWSNKKFFLLKK